jgi:tetratricopeptide (TPR) repeat protein
MKPFLYATFFVLLACNSQPKDQKNSKKESILPDEIARLEKLSKQFPDSVGLHMRLVNALDSLGNFELALVELNTLIKNDSSNFGLWFKKAQLSEQQKDTITAIKSYSRAANIYASPDALLALANLFAETKNSKALDLCQKVSDLRMGRTYQAHSDFVSGIYYARTGNASKAIQLFTNCIANNYTYMEAYMEIGFIHYDKKQYANALKTFQTAVTVKNNYPDGYYWLGKTNEANNNREAAIENYEKALSLDPKLSEAEQAFIRIKGTNAH